MTANSNSQLSSTQLPYHKTKKLRIFINNVYTADAT